MSLSGWVISSFESTKPNQPEHDKCGVIGKKRTRQHLQDLEHGTISRKANENNTPWVETYSPLNKGELAVHKKKIEEFEDWLRKCFQNEISKSKILIMTGPTGSGKTATVRTVAKHLNVTIKEWSNPVTHRCQQLDAAKESQTNVFREFLIRANKYNSLISNVHQVTKKMVLVKDFPNAFHIDPRDLHDILRRYSVIGCSPLILVVTDAYERVLLPKDFQQELGNTHITFNPVAPVSLLKTLTRIAQRAGKFIPKKEVLQELCETSNGDIRAAINALQFFCTVNSRNQKPIECKDSSLVIFRSLGKILHCKRDGKVDPGHLLPSHLKKYERSRLVNDPKDILHNISMTPDSLVLFLHENYISFFSDLEDVVRASSYFSCADALQCEWAFKDVLEGYSAYVTTLGVMNSNYSGVSSCGTKGRWRPLHKPRYYHVNKMNIQRTAAVNRLFRTNGSILPEELFLCRLPYLHISRPSWLPLDQKCFIEELYSEAMHRMPDVIFDEKDTCVSETADPDQVPYHQHRNQVNCMPLAVQEQDDPEMCIQEYSD